MNDIGTQSGFRIEFSSDFLIEFITYIQTLHPAHTPTYQHVQNARMTRFPNTLMSLLDPWGSPHMISFHPCSDGFYQRGGVHGLHAKTWDGTSLLAVFLASSCCSGPPRLQYRQARRPPDILAEYLSRCTGRSPSPGVLTAVHPQVKYSGCIFARMSCGCTERR